MEGDIMKINYENTLKIMEQSNEEFSRFIKTIFESIPKRLLIQINAGKEEGKALKGGFTWEFQDDGKEFTLIVNKNDSSLRPYMEITLNANSKKKLLSWKEEDGEQSLASVIVYLYKKEASKYNMLKVNYDFNIRVRKNDLVVNVETKTNTYIKENEDILEHNGITEMHRKTVGETYTVDVKKITGEERKSNKLI